jgi:hypothetical protein
MRPTLYKSRNALFSSAKRYNHNVSAQQKPSGLEGTIHHIKDVIGATTGRRRLHLYLRL